MNRSLVCAGSVLFALGAGVFLLFVLPEIGGVMPAAVRPNGGTAVGWSLLAVAASSLALATGSALVGFGVGRWQRDGDPLRLTDRPKLERDRPRPSSWRLCRRARDATRSLVRCAFQRTAAGSPAHAVAQHTTNQPSAVAAEYRPLYQYLVERFADVVVLTFSQIEDLLGNPLPEIARAQREWWATPAAESAPSVQSLSWTQASRTATPNLRACVVVFERRSA